MKRLSFDSDGRLSGIDNYSISEQSFKKEEKEEFLINIENINDTPAWSLYDNSKRLEPLKFTNNKNQEDIVKEAVNYIKSGVKIVLINGACGTGKSAIALNIARLLGRASIVVPVKGLQKQYEEDYSSKKYIVRAGKKMKIAMITGRENHDSKIKPGFSCADPLLPDTIQIAEKNSELLREYYSKNPLIKNKIEPEISKLKRISIAPANPYWSPIIPADYDVPLRDARKKRYKGLRNREFIFYHRKEGCSYYDQYQAYLDADIIIFNSAKYKIEVALDRKPETDLEIIDEADEFLDSFSTEQEINLTRLSAALKSISPDFIEAQDAIDRIVELIKLEEINKDALGIDESRIFHIKETKIDKILKLFIRNPELGAEIVADELNYANKALETAKDFMDFLDDTYATFRKHEKDLYVDLITTNLSKRFFEIINKNKALVLMSGTLHSEEVLRNIFGIKDFKVIDAETIAPGNIDIIKTGKEFDCRYSNFYSKKYSRKDYLLALSACMSKSIKPVLVHVNAFEDLPSEAELKELDILNLMPREKLKQLQKEDKHGRMISLFKSKLSDSLFSTKCSRGVDFPGDICNSVIFTKYPNPNVKGIFWKLLEKTHPDYYWEFYKDKARREFLQRIFRALRSKDDHVNILSPDSRVLDAVRELQLFRMNVSNNIQG